MAIQLRLNPDFINTTPSKYPFEAAFPKDIFIKILLTLVEGTPHKELHALFCCVSQVSRGSREIIRRIEYACLNSGAPFSILFQDENYEGRDIQIVQRIRNYLLNHPPLCSINFSGLKAIDDSFSGSFVDGLTHLNLSNCLMITSKSLTYMERLVHLRFLDLSYCLSLIEFRPYTIASLTNLTVLKMDNLRTFFLNLQSLSNLTKLTALSLGKCEGIIDDEIKHLTSFRRLTTLDLHGCKGVTSEGLAPLTELTALTDLNLNECRGIDNSGIFHIMKLTSLTSLGFAFLAYRITDIGIAQLNTLTNLTALNLSHNINLTNAILTHLTGLIRLNSLDLSCCDITDDGVKDLTKFTRLSTLHLICHKITDKSINQLTKLTNLTTLAFGGPMITNNRAEHLTKLTSLTSLQLIDYLKMERFEVITKERDAK